MSRITTTARRIAVGAAAALVAASLPAPASAAEADGCVPLSATQSRSVNGRGVLVVSLRGRACLDE